MLCAGMISNMLPLTQYTPRLQIKLGIKMQRESFTKALRATAKIACAASLLNVGCKNKAPAAVAAPTNTQTSPIEQPLQESPDSPFENDSNMDPTESEFKECQPVISATFANDAFPMPEDISQEVKDCCALTAAYYDALSFKTGDFALNTEWENRNECCSALEWSDGSMACTPWGPPTPPSARNMKRSVVVKQRSMVS